MRETIKDLCSLAAVGTFIWYVVIPTAALGAGA